MLLQGYLAAHFDTGKYQKIQLAPLQKEARGETPWPCLLPCWTGVMLPLP